MKVYAVIDYIPYEMETVVRVFSNIELTKAFIDGKIERFKSDFKQDNNYIHGFFDKWDHGYYIDEHEVLDE
jgi:hypothetical protein